MNIKKSFLVALATVTAAASVSAIAVNAETALGLSSEDAPFSVEDGKAVVTVNLDGGVGNNVQVTATVDSKEVADGEYFFHAALVADADLEKAFDAAFDNEWKTILELGFTDAEGKPAALKDVKIDVEADEAIAANAAFVVEESGDFTQLEFTATANGGSFVGPHFSKYILSALKDTEVVSKPEGSISEPISEPTSDVSEISDVSVVSVPGTTSETSTATSQTSTAQVSKSTTTTTTTTTSTTKSDAKSVATSDSGATTAAVFAVMGVVALGTAFAASKSKKASK